MRRLRAKNAWPVKLYTTERLAALNATAERLRAKKLAERDRLASENAAVLASHAESNQAASRDQFPEQMAFIENADAGAMAFGGDFVVEMRKKLSEGHALTENQAKAIERIIDASRWDAFTEDLIEQGEDIKPGRQIVTGYILKLAWRPSYGGGLDLKMLVLDERGFKLWGSTPQGFGFDVERKDDELDLASAKRMKISFKATLSSDEAKFGFFKRPADYQLLELPPGRAPRVEAETKDHSQSDYGM